MPFISLRESLTRSKAKWKERFRMGSNRPASTTDGASDPPSDAQPGSVTQHEPTEVIPTISASTQVGDHLSEPTITPNQPGENKPGAAWSITKFLLRTLESSTEAFGPLKSTIGGLTRCIDIYESASKGCKEYDELRAKLEGLLADLAKYTVPPMDLVMTNSVKRLCTDIEAELKNVEEIHAHKTGRRLVDAMDSSEEIMECYRRIHDHLERLTLNATMDILKTINKHTTETQLAGMSPAKSAIYNSAESDDLRRGGCAPGTRKDQIKLLLEWARNPDTGRTCWMNGMAGTGKTTIAYSVCEELDKAYELGASFFCSRIIPECRQIKYIVPSIAYQLARFSFPFRCALVKILESDPDAHARALKVQYQKLIVDPLVEVQGSLPTDLIVVIDALDECESEDSVGRMLDLLLSPTSALPIRYLLSSRPEPEISKRMANRAGTQGNGLLVLHDLDLDFVNADIATYVRHALKRVPVTEAQCEGLIERCGVLFIYASTTCRYIKQGYDMQTLNEAVSAILDSTSAPMGHGDETAIDTLYSTIITAAFDKSRISEANRTRMQNVLETVICAQEPMTTNAIAGILSLENAKQVDALLRPLRSVLNVAESTGLVTTLHASFPDFMFSSRRSGTFYCTQAKRHLSLSESCLRMIDTVEPKFNICGLPSSYLFDSEVDDLDERVRRSISSGLVYACRYWSAHLHLGEYHDGLVDIIHKFFATRLLIWMEILNLTKNMHLGTSIIREAENWCQVSQKYYTIPPIKLT
ncbi:hypothetical protein FRC11_005986 [Ceratobasidium sp. 423]|nr:hypothetical protein FRC11_005986 [Ceratobasidium sp. 423]